MASTLHLLHLEDDPNYALEQGREMNRVEFSSTGFCGNYLYMPVEFGFKKSMLG